MESFLEPYRHGLLRFGNRIVRSAVYEGRCDVHGFPTDAYVDYYEELARNKVGAIITGFAYVSREGRAMQPFQAGIDHPDKVPCFRKMTDAVHRHGCPVYLQIAHTGRQTLRKVTGTRPRGASASRSVYFREKPRPLSTGEVYLKIREFAEAALRAKQAGFDGVQIHAAHGYLVHQFLLPAINKRVDEFGIDQKTGIGSAFLERTILSIREKCGIDFPVLVKISGSVDLKPAFSLNQFEELIRFLDRMEVAAIEISYGTMDYALNIFRGDVPVSRILKYNPILSSSNNYKRYLRKAMIRWFFLPRLKPFTPVYNLDYASKAKKLTGIPVISVGGFRNGDEITDAIRDGKTDLAGLARPFIAEPDFVLKLNNNLSYESRCINCNSCSVMCDSQNETRCYKN